MSLRDAPRGDLFLTEIGTLAAVPPGPRRGAQMCAIPMIPDAAVLIQGGRIAWFGPRRDAPVAANAKEISARGGLVIPGLIDPHTHIPFAGDRSNEFVRRVAGETYLQIMQAGGGIRVTATAVRNASVDDLVRENLPRLERMLANGVTRVECKSGYGLLPEPELKQLAAIRALSERQPITLDPTYLGAHVLPREFEGRADEFIDTIGEAGLLRRIANEGLARFCDVFCDRGAFTVEQARRLLTRAREAGLKLKVHADELAQIGASVLAGELGAVSSDHLECIDDAGIAALAKAGTVAVILPGTSFFLGIEHADARRLIDAGLPVALATDFNPGSCMIESLPVIMSIACCQLRMLPAEVLTACTANAAAALDVADETGAVAVGHAGDLVVLDVPNLDRWFYEPGRSHVAAVIKGGRVVASVPAAG